MNVNLRVVGIPAPQGSKRHVGRGRLIESSKKVGPWRAAITDQAREAGLDALNLDEPLRINVAFYLPRPKSHSGVRGLLPSAPTWPARVPDLDKLLRSTLDGLTQAGVIYDDSCVVSLHAIKTYTVGRPGASIHITTHLEEQPK